MEYDIEFIKKHADEIADVNEVFIPDVIYALFRGIERFDCERKLRESQLEFMPGLRYGWYDCPKGKSAEEHMTDLFKEVIKVHPELSGMIKKVEEG